MFRRVTRSATSPATSAALTTAQRALSVRGGPRGAAASASAYALPILPRASRRLSPQEEAEELAALCEEYHETFGATTAATAGGAKHSTFIADDDGCDDAFPFSARDEAHEAMLAFGVSSFSSGGVPAEARPAAATARYGGALRHWRHPMASATGGSPLAASEISSSSQKRPVAPPPPRLVNYGSHIRWSAAIGAGGLMRASSPLLHRGLTTAERARVRDLASKKGLSEASATSVVWEERRAAALSVPASPSDKKKNPSSAINKKSDANSSSSSNSRSPPAAVSTTTSSPPPPKQQRRPAGAEAVPADYVKRVKSVVVDDIINKMTQKNELRNIRHGAGRGGRVVKRKADQTEAQFAEARVLDFVGTKRIADTRFRSQFRVDPNTPIDHLSLLEIYEYLFTALKGGDVQQQARRRIPMSMRMACGERSIEVPPPSFIYVLLQHDPNLLHESYHPRIAFAVEQWLKLPEQTRQYFADHPLKGISE